MKALETAPVSFGMTLKFNADFGNESSGRAGLPAMAAGAEGGHFSGRASRICSSRNCFGVASDGAPIIKSSAR